MPPVKMTRAEYQAKYGQAPAISTPTTSAIPVASSLPTRVNTTAPVKMTRAEYQAKYGQAPAITPTAPTQSDNGFLGNLAAGVLKTPARLATNLVQAGEIATGNKPTTPFSGSFLGDVQPVGMANGGGLSAQNLKDALGAGAELSSYVVGGPEVKAGAEALKTGELLAKPLAKTFLNAGKAAVVPGALFAGGQSMQDPNKDIGQNLLDTATGAATGFATGGALGLGGKALEATGIPNRLFSNEARTANVENKTFQQSLDDAEKSIYNNLTEGEKENVKVKDVQTMWSKKTVTDLQNDPITKPIIESVASLPEDIKLKPNDTLATRESKLNQGISRLHQATASDLSRPEMKAQTTFRPKDFDAFMKDNILDPIEKEFGIDSKKYETAQKGLATAKSSLPENNAYGVHTGRQSFDQIFKADNPSAFKEQKSLFGMLDPHVKNVVQTGYNIRGAMNDFAENLLPKNHPFRFNLKQESNLLRGLDELRVKNTGEIGQNELNRFIKKHPVLNTGLKAGASAARLGGLLELTKHL